MKRDIIDRRMRKESMHIELQRKFRLGEHMRCRRSGRRPMMFMWRNGEISQPNLELSRYKRNRHFGFRIRPPQKELGKQAYHHQILVIGRQASRSVARTNTSMKPNSKKCALGGVSCFWCARPSPRHRMYSLLTASPISQLSECTPLRDET